MKITKLIWDSDFFGLRIGRVDINTQEDVMDLKLKKYELQKDFDLIYIFDNYCTDLDSINVKLVDEKVLFRKKCEHKQMFSEVQKYEKKKPTTALYHLAYLSGQYSRFKIDTHFIRGSFERLYKCWIENSCPRPNLNKQIFVYRAMGREKGMITIDYHTTTSAKIGLAAVDKDIQHRGIGTKILSTAEEYLYQLGIKTLEVYTQKSNKKACLWYEKNGFKVDKIVKVYHWWLNS